MRGPWRDRKEKTETWKEIIPGGPKNDELLVVFSLDPPIRYLENIKS